jgi:chromosome segregation ATPase
MPLQMPDIDPHVLAHIIGELRHQLTDLSRERDDLLALLSAAHTKEAELKDALQHITDKAMDMDEALSEARRKTKDDEEAIKLLRTKVEESRYAAATP